MADERKPWIVETLKDVAAFFAVEYSTVKGEWRPAGMPGEPGAWDLAEILRWRDARRKSPAAGASTEVEIDGEPVTRAKLATLEQLERWRARRLKNDKTAGVLVDRQDAEREIGANYVRLKARLEAMADELQMELPPKVRAQLRERLESKVRLILTEIAGWSKEPSDEQPTRGPESPPKPTGSGRRAGDEGAAPAATAKGDRPVDRPAGRRPGKPGHRRDPAAGRRSSGGTGGGV